MDSNNQDNNNNESQNISNNNTESSTVVKKLNITHVAKAKLLRQKLREKKNKLESEKNPNSNENEASHSIIIPNNTSNSSSNNLNAIFHENEEGKEKEKEKEKIDPLKFVFSSTPENIKDDNDDPLGYLNEVKEVKDEENTNEESSDIPKIIILEASNDKKEDSNKNKYETPYPKNNKLISPQQQQNTQNKTTTKQYQFSKFVKKSDSDWDSSSSSDDDFEKNEMQRLINIKNAQQNLFKKNKTTPKETNPSTNKKQRELTQEDILQKLFLDFDKTSELLELNEKKKQIMLKKMRKTLHRLSNLRLRNINPEEEAKRNLINKKIEELKKKAGDNYNVIKPNVDKIIENLKMPDYYFGDDEDVEIISEKDINIKNNIIPIIDIDFSSFMRH